MVRPEPSVWQSKPPPLGGVGGGVLDRGVEFRSQTSPISVHVHSQYEPPSALLLGFGGVSSTQR
jgi:hypothetical protein